MRISRPRKDTDDTMTNHDSAPDDNPSGRPITPRSDAARSAQRDASDARRIVPRSERGEILTVEGTRARELEPVLRAAGYTIMPEQHDDLINIYDDATALHLSLSDQYGGRLLLRTCHIVRKDAPTADRATAVSALNELVWAKFLLDDDGDVVMTHAIGCAGGIHLPNLMRTIRNFLGLAQFVRNHPDHAHLFRSAPGGSDSADEE